MRCRLVEIERTCDRHDGFEMRRSFDGSFHLRSREVTDPNHSYIAVRPRLHCGPFHEVVHIAAFLAVKKTERAPGPTGPPAVRDDMYVPARNKEIAGTSFNEPCRSTKILYLPRIRRSCHQHRISAELSRTKHICQQCNSIPHWHHNVIIVGHDVNGLRQIAIFTSGRLRTVKFSLTTLNAGRWNIRHAFLPRYPAHYKVLCPISPASSTGRCNTL